MNTRPFPRCGGLLPLAAAILFNLGVSPTRGQAPAEVRRAFQDMRADNVPLNCSRAMIRLYPHRERLRDTLLDELYRTDRQGRDAILCLLFQTGSLVPDERLRRFVIARLAEQDTVVSRSSFGVPSDPAAQAAAGDLRTEAAHWLAWQFIDKHFNLFEPLLAEEIGRTDNVFVLWASVWLMRKRGVLAEHAALFTPTVMARAAASLRDDTTRFNATHAVRFFLLLGAPSLPTLRAAAASPEPQTANLARATADAITTGSRPAFGYLASKLGPLNRSVFGPEPPAPPWLGEVAEPFQERGRYP